MTYAEIARCSGMTEARLRTLRQTPRMATGPELFDLCKGLGASNAEVTLFLAAVGTDDSGAFEEILSGWVTTKADKGEPELAPEVAHEVKDWQPPPPPPKLDPARIFGEDS